MAENPMVAGYDHVSLSVRDLERSLDWYCDVLGFQRNEPFAVDKWKLRRVRLDHANGAILALTCHEQHADEPFDERRPGIDHVAFLAPTVEDVRAAKERCERRGDPASDIDEFLGAGSAKVTLRDPDNIQVEVVCRPPSPATG